MASARANVADDFDGARADAALRVDHDVRIQAAVVADRDTLAMEKALADPALKEKKPEKKGKKKMKR